MQKDYGKDTVESPEAFANHGLRMMEKTIEEDSGYPMDTVLLVPLNRVVASVVRDRLKQG